MKLINKIKLIIPMLLAVLVLASCQVGEERYELTSYIGETLADFQKGTGAKLILESNDVYAMEGVVQVIVKDGKIDALTLLSSDSEYTIDGVSIGMELTQAEPLLKAVYGKEISKVINTDETASTYYYLGQNKKLYVTYDLNNMVSGISYYYVATDQDNQNENVSTGELMLMVGDTRVYYNEAIIYIKSAMDHYENEYSKGVWNVDIYGDGRTFDQLLKDEIIKQITELKIIEGQAEKQGVILSEEEQTRARNYAKDHYAGLTVKDIDQYFITEDLLKKVYEDNLLANKMFETTTINVDNNVPDEIAKQITVNDILIRNHENLTAEERQQAFNKVQDIWEQAKTTEDFKTLAEGKSESEIIEYTFGRGGGPEEYSESFEQASFTLKTGEVSDIITTEYGWHILYCVTDFNEDATIQVKEAIIEERRNDMFAKLYSEWSSEYDVVVNNEAWNGIILKE